MFVHQDGPFAGCEGSEEGVGMRGAGLWAGREELFERSDQPLLFRCEVGLIQNNGLLDGWRVAAHGLVILEDLWLDRGTEDSSDELAWWPQLAGGHLHAEGTVCERLRHGHGAPLTRTAGLKLCNANLERMEVVKLKQAFHAAILSKRGRG